MGNDFLLDSKRIAFAVLVLMACGRVASQAQSTAASSAVAGLDESIFTRIAPNDCQAPKESEIAEVKSAITNFQNHRSQTDEMRALVLLGSLYEQEGEYKLALAPLQSALKLARDDASKAQILTMTADALTQAGSSDAAANDAAEALKLSKDPNAKASALRARAEAHFYSAREQALADLNAALTLIGDAGDLKTKAIVLTDRGASQQDASSPFGDFKSALQLEDQIHDCRDKIATLVGLATLEHDRGHLRDALDHFGQATALESRVGDHTMEAETLHQLGYFHWEIGDLAQALSLFNRALDLKKQAADRASESMTLAALAGVYRDTHWPAAALRAYLKVLPMLQGNGPWQVIVLNNLGMVEADLHNKTEARTYYNKAMQLAPAAKDPVTPAYSQWGIGELEESDALQSYFRSVRLAREYEQSDLEGMVDSSLMDHFRAQHQPNVAIFFGKRAVDQFQSIRRNMSDTGNDLASSFLHKKSGTYRTLAEILIDQGRLIEAQQVLDLLKIQQYSDYVGAQLNELSQPLTRSPREGPLQQQFEEKITQLVNLDKASVAALSANHRQSSAAIQAQAALREAESGFDAFLQNLYLQLEAKDGAAVGVQSVSGAELPLERLVAKDPQAVALYTLEGTNDYRVIVISHTGRFARCYPITQEKLDEESQRFVELLGNHKASYTVPAQDLFKIVVGPIEKDLEAMGAKTLVWYLDGSLRYIPIAALLNPQTHRFVVEDFSVITFTPLNPSSIEDVPELNGAQAIAMGISGKYFNNLPPLSNVKDELKSVASDPSVTGSHGVLPGKILIDGQFTEKAMEKNLSSQAVVHIASHFVLTPGNDDLSYLLLGGKDRDASGYKYSMADFEKSGDLHLEGTKLLTLSACQTAAVNERETCFESKQSSVSTAICQAGRVNQRENGVVMESMSEAVLEKGAEAVISSLWSVNDKSTSEFMADFYGQWAGSKGTISKAQALRQAELDLLHSNDKSQPAGSGRGISAVEDGPGAGASARGYAHPYYWAPFVLMGNWQ